MGWDIDRPKPEVSANAPPDLNVYLQVESDLVMMLFAGCGG